MYLIKASEYTCTDWDSVQASSVFLNKKNFQSLSSPLPLFLSLSLGQGATFKIFTAIGWGCRFESPRCTFFVKSLTLSLSSFNNYVSLSVSLCLFTLLSLPLGKDPNYGPLVLDYCDLKFLNIKMIYY